MITNLYWRPGLPKGYLSNELKCLLARRFWSQDGFEPSSEYKMSRNRISDIAYLQGLHDAGIKGADRLLKLIEEHASVTIWIGKGRE